jgi:hypothetical protein
MWIKPEPKAENVESSSLPLYTAKYKMSVQVP